MGSIITGTNRPSRRITHFFIAFLGIQDQYLIFNINLTIGQKKVRSAHFCAPITSQHCFWMSIHWIYMWIGNVSFYVVRYLLCDCLFVDTGYESWHRTLISRNIKSNTHSKVADLLLSWPLSTSFEADKAVGSSTELPLCIPARLSDAVPTSSPPSTLKLLWRAEEETKVLITIHQIFILCQYGNTSDRETSCKIEYMHH